MKLTLLLLLLVFACLAVIYTVFPDGTLVPAVAETKGRAVEAVTGWRIPVSKIDQSSGLKTSIKEALTWYSSALEYAPALPAPPMGNSRTRRDPL